MRQLKMRNYSTRTRRHGGFTLVEITVVLVIVSIVSALTLSGFKSLTQSNQRTTCQANMVQLYQAMRLYSADENGGFPPYDSTSTPNPGIGLWALYTYPNADNPNYIARPDDAAVPIERYLRHAKSLHCPADNDDADETLLMPDPNDATKQIYNLNYCSYQSLDGLAGTAPGEPTYQPSRTTDKSACASNPACDWKRQLLHFYNSTPGPTLEVRPPAADTIVTWCRWHRPAGTFDTARPYDNVLFYDGTVRYLSVAQTPVTTTAPPPAVTGWQRLPTS